MSEQKVFGWDSAVQFAKSLEYGKNVEISAQLIIDVSAEIERLKKRAEINRLKAEIYDLRRQSELLKEEWNHFGIRIR